MPMIKQYRFHIPDFPHYRTMLFKPVRSGRDCINLLVTILRFIYNYKTLNVKDSRMQLIIHVSKNSRVILLDDSHKVSSLTFPFTITEDENGYAIRSSATGDLNEDLLEEVNTILGLNSAFGKVEQGGDLSSIADAIMDMDAPDPRIWSFVTELLLAETGYMRVETDPDNENGQIHPLHHIDIFCTQPAKVKLGLHDPMNEQQILDMLDLETPCHYLSDAI